MLNDPSAFATAVQALLASQKQAIDAKSVAAGEHLCFMGSGREEEDCYVNMVVASFLQKHHRYVSLLHGGYQALHRFVLAQSCEHLLVDHCKKMCLSCAANRNVANGDTAKNGAKKSAGKGGEGGSGEQSTSAFLAKLSTVVRPRFTEMKDKIVEFATNPNAKPIVKHVSSMDKVGKRYKGSKFSLDDTLDLG